jgi:hypothetical protein
MQQNPFEPNPSQALPIPLPEGLPPSPVPVVKSGDWHSAPLVVRSWAYTLAFLSMWIVFLFGALSLIGPEPMPQKIGITIFCLALFAVFLWQRKKLQNSAILAWKLQILLSILGLIWFPLGTLIHGYILSQWFKPEVKAWFGQR